MSKKKNKSKLNKSVGNVSDESQPEQYDKKNKTPVKQNKIPSDDSLILVDESPLQISFVKEQKRSKRLTFFKYPEELGRLFASEEQFANCYTSLQNIILKNSEFAKSEKKRPVRKTNNLVNEINLADDKQKKGLPIKEYLLFGLNEILKKIKQNRIAFVMLLDPLTTHVQSTVIQIAHKHQTPLLLMPNLNKMASLFGVSTSMCIGITKETLNPSCLFYEFFQQINKVYQECKEMAEELKQPINEKKKPIPLNLKNVQNKTKKKNTVLRFHSLSPECFYSLRSTTEDKLKQEKDDLLQLKPKNLQDFTKVSSLKDDFFPPRPFMYIN